MKCLKKNLKTSLRWGDKVGSLRGMSRRLVGGVFVILLFLAGCGVYLGVRTILSVNPRDPYFSAKEDRIGQIHWSFGYFFPVYLRAFEKDDHVYVQVAYRNTKNKIKVLNVDMGQKGALVPVKSPDGWIKFPQGLADFQKGYRIGQRVKIGYYRNVIRRQESGYTTVLPMTDSVVVQYCMDYPRDCEIAKYTLEHNEDYWNFKLTGDFDKTVHFKAISMEPL